MPTMTVMPAGTRTWGLACAIAFGTYGTVVDDLQTALERTTAELVRVDRTKINFQDTGRREEHDSHRQSLLAEAKALQEMIDAETAADATTAEAYSPWEFFTT